MFFFFLLSVWVCRPFVFFFQAEDGIRDATVTGVQTCALPILDDDVEHSVGLGLQVERRLVRLDLGDHLALLDGVTALLLPLDDRALLHRVGELRHIYISHRGTSCRPPRAPTA